MGPNLCHITAGNFWLSGWRGVLGEKVDGLPRIKSLSQDWGPGFFLLLALLFFLQGLLVFLQQIGGWSRRSGGLAITVFAGCNKYISDNYEYTNAQCATTTVTKYSACSQHTWSGIPTLEISHWSSRKSVVQFMWYISDNYYTLILADKYLEIQRTECQSPDVRGKQKGNFPQFDGQ